MSRPLAIWTTGAPVPTAEHARGSFFDMIVRHTRDEMADGHQAIDARKLNGRAAMVDLLSLDVSGVIITGSPAHLRQNEEWMKWTMAALTELDRRGVPIFGICFGHQLLGQALGGVVDANPKGREVGTFSLDFRAQDELMDGLSAEPHIVMTHLDSVIELPPRARVIASTAGDENAAIRFSERTWGVQFHPEMDAEVVGYYLAERREAIVAEGIDVDQVLAARRDSLYGRQLLQKFARFCANGGSGALVPEADLS